MGWPVYIENKPDLVKFVAVMVDVFLCSWTADSAAGSICPNYSASVLIIGSVIPYVRAHERSQTHYATTVRI